ncbi:MAG: permease [Fibrobacteria bacterium]|nr:permease [Fibrobacteria bacterium]
MLKHPGHRQVLRLAVAQMLFMTTSVMVATVGSLAGARIAPSPAWATFPVAAMLLGSAAMTFPASAWMERVGRRNGFLTGAAFGLLGGLTAALGVYLSSLALLAAGTFFVGSYQAFAQFYRFAAGEVSDAAFRPRAISLVLAGGVVAAFTGTLLARWGGPWIPAHAYLGSFLLLALVSVAALGLLRGVRVPAASTAELEGPRRPWSVIVGQPTYLVALFGAATGLGAMVLAMTATPIAMAHHHHGLDASATVIQLHILGMFVPSFFTGSLIARFGVLPVMFMGVLLLGGHVAGALLGTGFLDFATALVFLGVGWNFLYIGGTTLLTGTYTPSEKSKAQAINDMTVSTVGMVCSFSAGGLLAALGWSAMNVLLLPWLGLAALAIGWLGWRTRRIRVRAGGREGF